MVWVWSKFGGSFRQFGWLSETDSTTLFAAKNDTPMMEQIANATLSVRRPGGMPWYEKGTIRSDGDTIKWASDFSAEVKKDYAAGFIRIPNKEYASFLFLNEKQCELNLVFRLSTRGVQGSTSFRISWRRIDEGKFFCV